MRKLFQLQVLVMSFAGLPTAPAFAQPPPAAKTAQPEGSPRDAKTLLKALATLPGLEATFREEKHLALLKAPLVSEGRLFYMRPGYLVREVVKPSPSTVRIGPGALEVSDGKERKRIDLQGRPDVKTFIESFTRVLAGDYETLSKTYEIGFEPQKSAEEPWTLTLKPRSETLRHLIRSVQLLGKGYAVTTIRVAEASGDHAETQISVVSAQRKFSAEERRRLFGLESTP